MKRNATVTKQKILAAATSEFAAYGFAGARVDRIAERAGYNKQLIYAYFGSKEGLFEVVAEHHLSDVLDTVPLNPHDLPEYAAKLHDYNRAHPDLVKLVAWFALEGIPSPTVATALVASMKQKTASIRQAQETGAIRSSLNPEVLLQMVLALSGAWTVGTHALDAQQGVSPAAQREAIVGTVRLLVSGGTSDTRGD
jgi:AcrR family transcriptional regulator